MSFVMKETLLRQTHLSERENLEAWSDKGQLFALVDPFFDIPLPLEKQRLETKDTDPVFFELIAWDQVRYQPPSVVKITRDVLDWVLNSLSTERWGVFLVSEHDLATLARHYQKFVIAKGPDANPYFLRFHDASVLEVLLKTWESKERAVFFGPVMAFGLPDLDTMKVRIEFNPYGTRGKTLPEPEDCLLHLRDAQLKACGEAIDRDLVKVIYWHLRNHHSKSVQFLEKNVLETRIVFSISKARRYSLGSVSDLAGFTALMFELAPNFDEHPSFRNVLMDPSVPPEGKMRRLSQVISDREWGEALSLYDRSFWASVQQKRKR
jgi:hypothetical protein